MAFSAYAPVAESAAALVWRPLAGDARATPGFYKLLGLPRDAPVSFSTLLEVAHPDDAVSLASLVSEHLRTHEPFHVKHRVLRSDASELWVQTLARFFEDERGNLEEMLLVVDRADPP